MDVENWQAARIANSRYRQDGPVKPWPWGVQVQVIGAKGSGRHSLINRICHGDPSAGRDSGCAQVRIRNLPISIWFEAPPSLTDFGVHSKHLTKQDLFGAISRGLRDCDALILVYDLAEETTFQALCKFCRRCEVAGLGVAPGKPLPVLVVGTKSDRPRLSHVEDGQRLARRLGGTFVTASARTGEGFEDIIAQAIDPVLDARVTLIQESEAVLGRAIRALLARTAERNVLRRFAGRGGGADPDRRPEMVESRSGAGAGRFTGAPPAWTMRKGRSPATWEGGAERVTTAAGRRDSMESDATLLVPCPPEFQVPVDVVASAATNWAPKF